MTEAPTTAPLSQRTRTPPLPPLKEGEKKAGTIGGNGDTGGGGNLSLRFQGSVWAQGQPPGGKQGSEQHVKLEGNVVYKIASTHTHIHSECIRKGGVCLEGGCSSHHVCQCLHVPVCVISLRITYAPPLLRALFTQPSHQKQLQHW